MVAKLASFGAFSDHFLCFFFFQIQKSVGKKSLHYTCHVKVGQSTHGGPIDHAGLDALDPEVVGEEHAEDGDALVVVGSGHRSADVSGDDGDHGGGHQSRPLTVQLHGEEVRDQGGEGAEQGCQEDADVADVEGDVAQVGKEVEDGGGDHEAGVDGAADDPAQRVPGPVVEPVVEGVETLVGQVLGRSVVEVGIELVNHGLVAQHRKQPDRKG